MSEANCESLMQSWPPEAKILSVNSNNKIALKGKIKLLTPMDIHNKEFKKSFRGYSTDEVNDFLDQVVNDYDKLCRENEQLKDDVSIRQRELDQYHNLEKNLQDTLLLAQKTADEVINHAKKTAEDEREQAKQECSVLRRQTELDVKNLTEEAAAKMRRIEAENERLTREKNNFLNKIRILLESELAMLNQTAETLMRPNYEPAEEEKATIPAPSEETVAFAKEKPKVTEATKNRAETQAANVATEIASSPKKNAEEKKITACNDANEAEDTKEFVKIERERP